MDKKREDILKFLQNTEDNKSVSWTGIQEKFENSDYYEIEHELRNVFSFFMEEGFFKENFSIPWQDKDALKNIRFSSKNLSDRGRNYFKENRKNEEETELRSLNIVNAKSEKQLTIIQKLSYLVGILGTIIGIVGTIKGITCECS